MICQQICKALYTHRPSTVTLINPRRACAARVTVVGSVCMCVCVSVKSHLTSGASVRPENTVTYSAGNGGRKICGDFSETAPLQGYTASCIVGYCSDIPLHASARVPLRNTLVAHREFGRVRSLHCICHYGRYPIGPRARDLDCNHTVSGSFR